MAQTTVRPATANDKEDVLAFCVPDEGGEDYIQYVWDSWLNDSQGQLFVATDNQKPVGVVHMQMLTEIDAWIEGLRVSQDHRREGIGKALMESAIVEAMRREGEYIRLVVDADNTPSIRLCESLHLRPVSTFALYSATPFPPRSKERLREGIRVAEMDDIDEIIDYLNSSSIFPLVGGLYYVQFKAYPITADLLEQKIQAQQVYILKRWEKMDGIAIAEVREERGEHRISVGYIDGTAIEPISFLAYDLRHRLSEMEMDRVRIYAPDLVLIRDAFDGAEYESDGGMLYTYERGLV
jgi:ribosomal protein S18 acetylase RimI-like enzyme